MNSLKPKKLILIGASTGGPGLLEKIVTSLDRIDFTIIIAQHMDRLSLSSFAKRLNRISENEVIFVDRRVAIENSKIYLLEDTSHIVHEQSSYYLQKESESTSFYHPDIDIFFSSALIMKDIIVTAYLLSGIGKDGAKGMLALKKSHCRTVAQDEKTSIVYGMPKSAKEMDACGSVMSIDKIIADIKG